MGPANMVVVESSSDLTARPSIIHAARRYLPPMKSEYFVLLPSNICNSLQSFAAIALKTKKLRRNVHYS